MTEDTNSIRLDFSKEHTSFDFENKVSGRLAVMQSVLVHVATRRGSYPAYPNGGTDLPAFVTGYGVAVWAEAEHAGNFSALATKKFLNLFIENTDPNKIAGVRVVLNDLVLSRAHYNIQATFPDGEVIGLTETVQR